MARSLSLRRQTWLRLPLAIIVSLMLLAALGGSAAAAPPTLIRETATSAHAFSDECVVEPDRTEVCTSVSVSVFSSGSGWEVCVSRFTVTFHPNGDVDFTDEFGCTIVPEGAFSIDRQLTSASLEPVTVTVFTFECDEFGNCVESSREVTVSGDWTGDGNLIRFNDRSSFQDGKCKFMFMGKGTAREASATFTYDGQTFEADDAFLVTARQSIKISSACEPFF